jgi:triacylglycerol lipase
MFFIHGGGNYNGQSIFYNGTALVQHSVEIEQPIIYVGINYRLGGFGFLTSPDFNDAGLSNLGLMDQRLALEWVHDQIAGFGGDPEKVTIFGESAGAANC